MCLITYTVTHIIIFYNTVTHIMEQILTFDRMNSMNGVNNSKKVLIYI